MTSFMRFTHILCPTDYSEPAASALEHAGAVAGWYKARVTLLHVCVGPPAEADRVRLLREAATAREAAGAPAPFEVAIAEGDPARSILSEAERLPADLLVMGTHGTSGFKRFILGSVTEKVLRQAPAPVLTVPPSAGTHANLPFRRVLCGVDFSACSLSALEYARSLAAESDASLLVVHALEWPWDEPPAPAFDELPAVEQAALRAFRRRREQEASERLAAVAGVGDGCQILARVVHGKAYAAVLRVAADEHADLIVLGIGGRGGADRALFGSTTNHVVRRATCPVLTIHRSEP
jgi:nucleotide-binding universal stress UspA family protein